MTDRTVHKEGSREEETAENTKPTDKEILDFLEEHLRTCMFHECSLKHTLFDAPKVNDPDRKVDVFIVGSGPYPCYGASLREALTRAMEGKWGMFPKHILEG